MLVFTDNLRALVIWSLVCGAALCLFYDVIRVSRTVFGVSTNALSMRGKPLFYAKFAYLVMTDFLFCTVSAICFLLLAYYTNGGIFRGLIVACGIVGFVIMRLSLSRIFTFILLKFALIIKRLIKVVFWISGKITKPIFWIYHLTLGKIICIIKDRVKKKREMKFRQISGKEENEAVLKDQGNSGPKGRIFIGRREEKLRGSDLER